MEVIVEENFYKKVKKMPKDIQMRAFEVEEIKHRLIVLEKVVTSLIEIEEVSPKNLSKEEKRHLERTLSYIREGRHDKFMGLDEFGRKLNLR